MFGKCLEKIFEQSIQESRPKIRGPQSSWKRLGQKAKPSPTKNRFKFQNNNPKTGRRALARRPVFGRRACAPRCCFEICIDFLLDFAWLFGWLDSLLAYALGWLFAWMFATPDFWDRFLDRLMEFYFCFPNFSKVSCQKHFFGERSWSIIDFPKSVFPDRFFPNIGFSRIDFVWPSIA